jgi:hypothetical protein
MNEIKPGRRVVGRDGPPTPETAPWGVRYWPRTNGDIGFVWHTPTPYTNASVWRPDTEWEPLPEPSSEYVSAPEPEPRWSHDRGFIKCLGSPINEAEINAAVDALNTLDRDGVVYGPGRPMEELPDGDHERVLILGEWGSYIAANTARYDDSCQGRVGWWPLPVPEDTNAG